MVHHYHNMLGLRLHCCHKHIPEKEIDIFFLFSVLHKTLFIKKIKEISNFSKELWILIRIMSMRPSNKNSNHVLFGKILNISL